MCYILRRRNLFRTHLFKSHFDASIMLSLILVFVFLLDVSADAFVYYDYHSSTWNSVFNHRSVDHFRCKLWGLWIIHFSCWLMIRRILKRQLKSFHSWHLQNGCVKTNTQIQNYHIKVQSCIKNPFLHTSLCL